MAYSYDDGDHHHIIQTTYTSGRVVDYSRDGVRRIEGIETSVNGTAQNIISNTQYRGVNQILSCDYGNGLSSIPSNYTYDLNDNRLTQTRHAGLDPASSKTIDDLIKKATGSNRILTQNALSLAREKFR